MGKEQKINELQQKIESLSRDIYSFQQELGALQNELNALKSETGNSEIVKRKPVATSDNNSFENFIGLRFMHIIGIVVFVTGLSIGVKYAIDRQLVSEVMRIILAYVAGAVLFILSLRLKNKYQLFSAILFSGSMASVYFTTYAAFVYYNFFPFFIAFAIMIALTIYTVISAISYNRQEIAILGMIGAYGIPFLISANAERVDLFFSYILMINIGVVFISFKRSWKWMQYLALLITWILFIGWGLMRYNGSSQQTIGILFMAAYYILFLITALARRLSQATNISAGEIQQVVINNFALYVASILIFTDENYETNLAIVTGISALFAVILAFAFFVWLPAEIILQRMVAWQAIILVVLFIGFEWDGLTVTLLWIGTALLLFIWGMVYKRSWPRLASILLIGITLGKLIIFKNNEFSTVQRIISFLVIGALLLLFSFYYQKFNLVNSKQGRDK